MFERPSRYFSRRAILELLHKSQPFSKPSNSALLNSLIERAKANTFGG